MINQQISAGRSLGLPTRGIIRVPVSAYRQVQYGRRVTCAAASVDEATPAQMVSLMRASDLSQF